MSLTLAQLQELKADIAANANTIPAGFAWTNSFAGVAVSAVPNSSDGNATVAGWYNQIATGPFLVFRTNAPNSDIFNQILFANYTPVDAITGANAAQWTACSMACQGKQFNLQIMVQPGGNVNAGLVNVRKGLKDAMTALPTGTSFASQDGGWNATLNTTPNVLTRSATFAEKLFAVVTSGPLAGGTAALGTGGVQGTSNVAALVFEGSINGDVVANARIS